MSELNPEIKIFENRKELKKTISHQLERLLDEKKSSGERFFLALSGGSTPAEIYQYWQSRQSLNGFLREKVHFFWGDERCVPPDDPESNFHMVSECLLKPLGVPEKNIHRLRGESDPDEEALRYASEIRNSFGVSENEIPQFDWILLGLGADGHTASLFPGIEYQQPANKLIISTQNPASGQKRLSFSLELINAARRVSFIVTGGQKKIIVREILKNTNYLDLPASAIRPHSGIFEWFLDKEAAQLLNSDI